VSGVLSTSFFILKLPLTHCLHHVGGYMSSVQENTSDNFMKLRFWIVSRALRLLPSKWNIYWEDSTHYFDCRKRKSGKMWSTPQLYTLVLRANQKLDREHQLFTAETELSFSKSIRGATSATTPTSQALPSRPARLARGSFSVQQR
jgi:hypothetical protein